MQKKATTGAIMIDNICTYFRTEKLRVFITCLWERS
jgi:hypothetical protein